MIKRMENTIPLVYDIVGYAIEQTHKEALFFNQEQLLEGLKSNGKYLKVYASDTYAMMKRQMNQRPPDRVADAHYTGELFDLMYLRANGETVTFGSTSEHGTFMEKRDGLEIFGLTAESIQKYKEIYMPVAQRIVRERTVGIY